ncbi:MAG: hypothetical protein JWO91_1399 [Acidobacteriaceae bacterium]|nr:hypothetical protein [Acidobacteriaceae bacterium]
MVFPNRTSMSRFRLFASFPVLLATTLAAGVVLFNTHGGGRMFEEGDTWWHVSTGEQILATGGFPHADPYSFSAPGVPWLAYEWLGEVAMAEAEHFGSLRGLAILLALNSVTLVLLTYIYAWLRTRNVLAAAAAVALLLPFEQLAFTLRPQMFGYVFIVVTLVVLELYKQRESRLIWSLPGIFALWVNTHGSFIVGLAIVFWYGFSGLFGFRAGAVIASKWTSSGRVRLLTVMLLCSIALFVTPYGGRLAAYPLELFSMQPLNTLFIPEWQPLELQAPLGRAFLLLLLGWLLAQILVPVKYELEVLVPILFAAYLTCMHRRFLPIFLVILTPVIATYLARLLPTYEESKERYAMNIVLMAVTLFFVIGLIPTTARLEKEMERELPVGAVTYLRDHPMPTRMFNDDHWGGFLIWSLGSRHKVFIDGRLDIYEYSGVLEDYIRIVADPKYAKEVFRKYKIEACLVNREGQSDLVSTISHDPAWKTAYSDAQSVIFLRDLKPQEQPEITQLGVSGR